MITDFWEKYEHSRVLYIDAEVKDKKIFAFGIGRYKNRERNIKVGLWFRTMKVINFRLIWNKSIGRYFVFTVADYGIHYADGLLTLCFGYKSKIKKRVLSFNL